MAEKYSIPRGTFDILPDMSYKWQYVIEAFRNVARVYNYREIVTPIFENSGLFERSVGEVTDIVEKEMYKFSDKKGRIFALRPEGTAPVVRSFVENSLDKTGSLNKLYYVGPMFRYDRPQKGRYRQFYQYGVELIGSDNSYYDAEVISFAMQFFKTLGLTNYRLEINSIGCSNCSPKYDNILKEYFTEYKDQLCGDCQRRIVSNPKRLLDCKNESCIRIADKAPSILDYLDESCQKSFTEVKDYLDNLNINYVVNPRIIRGLDYYNKTAFEIITDSLGSQNALLGGGRYNTLIKDLGGPDLPAIGFAGGFERLLAVMEAEKLSFGEEPKPLVYIVSLGEKAATYALKICAELRNKGIAVEYDIDRTSLKGQMKAADRSSAEYTLIIGEDELANDMMTLKNMKDGTQQKQKASDLLKTLLTLKN
ncbi:MAG: histidine--tRNA ligase [Candidatus Cloacimonetes bacterium]|nr:histidine--tRNA ligase [Candidatus Cloacimonadota bacterium]